MTITDAAEIIARSSRGPVNSISPLGEGDFCVAFLVNDATVWRFAKHDAAVASLRRESCLLIRIAHRFDVSVPLPRLGNERGPSVFVTYPVLFGPALTRTRYLRLPPRARDRCAMQLGRFLSTLHATDLAVARECGVGMAHDRPYFAEILTRARQSLFAAIDEPQRKFIESAITSYVTSTDPPGFRPALVHGDISPDHVLYDEAAGSVTGIIDFGDVAITDPAWDLMFIYEDYGLDFMARVVRAYETRDLAGLLKRMYGFYVLALVEWAVWCAEGTTGGLQNAIDDLRRLSRSEATDLGALFSACRVKAS